MKNVVEQLKSFQEDMNLLGELENEITLLSSQGKSFLDIKEECEMVASLLNYNLEYVPNVFVEDINDLHEDSSINNAMWQLKRAAGIGGSDAGKIMGVNRYQGIKSLALDKIELREKLENISSEDALESLARQIAFKNEMKGFFDPGQQYIFDYGHGAEQALSSWFKYTSRWYTTHEDMMFNDSEYPFMLADLDGLVYEDNDPSKLCGLEFKTTNPRNKRLWKSGVLGEDAICPNLSYIVQIRHYMRVRNLYRFYLVVSFNNGPSDNVVIRVDRDISLEKELVDKEKIFWEKFILNKKVPEDTFVSANELEVLRKDYYVIRLADVSSDEVEDDNMASLLRNYFDLRNNLKALEEQVKEQKDLLATQEAAMLDSLIKNGSAKIKIHISEDEYVYVEGKLSKARAKFDRKALKKAYPEIEKEFTVQPEEQYSGCSVKISEIYKEGE